MNQNNGRIKMVDDPDLRPTRINPVPISDLIDENPTLRNVVIEGILRRGETCNIIAAAKVGKSHLAHGLAWCIATGIPWLSHEVTKGRVLIIDNELHAETLANRLDWIANKLMINRSDYADTIDVISLRGQNIDIHGIGHRLDTIEPGTYSLAIVDALYRTLPAGTSENDNAAMMAIYNKLDHYASQWDCAIAVVHHASKGQQGDKSITDVGAGAGSISRAADTHLVIRQHENPELSVLECVTRSFKSPKPASIRFDYPLWNAVGTEATVKKQGRQTKDDQAKSDSDDATALLEKIPMMPKAIQQNKLFESFGIGKDKFYRLVGKLARDGKVKIRRRPKKGSRRVLVFYSQLRLDSANENTGEC